MPSEKFPQLLPVGVPTEAKVTAVIVPPDEQFNTTDVCMIVKSDLITGRYRDRYEGGSGRGRGKAGDEGA